MLNVCGVIRPLTIVIASLGVLSILAPEAFASVWPYFAAAGVLVVPVLVYRWWDQRYNPGCSVRWREREHQVPAESTAE